MLHNLLLTHSKVSKPPTIVVDAVAVVVVVIGVQCYCEIVAAVISYKTFDICNGRKWDQFWGEFQGTFIVPAHVYVYTFSLFFPYLTYLIYVI